MAQRNYPCDSHISAYFGEAISLDLVGRYEFQAQLYLCLMAQTLWMKGEIERRRSQNSLGLLVGIGRCHNHAFATAHALSLMVNSLNFSSFLGYSDLAVE
jgi:hypothetical protein